MGKALFVKKGDIIVIAAILLAALAGLAILAGQHGHGAAGLTAEIYLHGELAQSIKLAGKEQEIRLKSSGGYNVLQAGPQGIRIAEADCHNQDCVHAGLKSHAGEIIACLPHRLLIRLMGPKGGELDAIAY